MEYYIYVYLDPREPGNFIYGSFEFKYKPFYIGKGKFNRLKDHLRFKKLKNDTNLIKVNKINNIINSGYLPIIEKIYDNLSEEESYEKEKEAIEIIGRIIKKNGPLTNIIDGGYGFTSNDAVKTWENDEIRDKRIKSMHDFWDKITDEDRKIYSDSKKGEKNPFYGKKHSDKLKEERSSKYSGEGNPMFGKTGENSPHWGKKHSDDVNKIKSIKMLDYHKNLTLEHKSEIANKKSIKMLDYHKNLTLDKKESISKKISDSNKGKKRGENNPMSKLTITEVIEIREYYSQFKSKYNILKILSDKYNVSRTCIKRIVTYQSWVDI